MTTYRNRKPVVSFIEAEWIRKQVAAGARQSDLAKQFDVHASEISQIVSGKRFARDVEQISVDNQMRNAQKVMDAATARLTAFNNRRAAQAIVLERDGCLKRYKPKKQHSQWEIERQLRKERKQNEEMLDSLTAG